MNACDILDVVEDIDEDMPLELMEHANAALMETLPLKSKEKYNRVYKNFKSWQASYGVTTISSQLIMAYFHVLDEKKYKPTSLWAFHSMLKSTLRAYENVDIGKFCSVSSFLKTKFSGYKCVKAKVFHEAEIQKFIDEADDLAWLDVKVTCIFGICGACRTDELTRITMDDIERHGNIFLVTLQQTKTKVSGSFTINGQFAAIVQKYMDLRPARLQSKDRFFVNFQRGKCTNQFIGKNKFALMPRRIAAHLGLLDVERYTGHAFRRTSATILANNGADLETIMRHGRWRNGSCARGYIEESIQYKARTGQLIQSSVMGSVSTAFAPALRVAPTSSFAPTSVPIIPIASVHAPVVTSSVPSVALAALTVAPTSSFAFTAAPIAAPAAPITPIASVPATVVTSSLYSVNNDFLFDSLIGDDVLIDIVDRASQAKNGGRSSVRCETDVDDDYAAFDSLANLTQSNNISATTQSNNISATTQSNNNSSLNAILSRSFKSVNFQRVDNCRFNFYLSNSK